MPTPKYFRLATRRRPAPDPRFINWLFLWGLLAFASALTIACKGDSDRPGEGLESAASNNDPAWEQHLAEHSRGLISRHGKLRVRFVRDMETAALAGGAPKNLLHFDPPIEGELRFSGARELLFTPDQPMQAGQRHVATLDARAMPRSLPDLAPYRFEFTVRSPDFQIRHAALESDGQSDAMVLRGTLDTADAEPAEQVEKILSLELHGKSLPLQWSHFNDDRTHYFSASDIPRESSTQTLRLRWSGASIGVDRQGSREIEVPSQSNYKVLGTRVEHSARTSIVIHFSDRLDEQQDLSGLIQLGRRDRYRLNYRIDGSRLMVDPDPVPVGKKLKLSVFPGIRNVVGKKLGQPFESTVEFADHNPQVRFAGNGVILPDHPVLSIPFETRNVHSVRVTAFRIFEDNVHQFLQGNQLDGNHELHRVGRYLWQKTIRLPTSTSNQWTRQSLDATDLLRNQESGGLYRIRLSIDRGHSTYSCPSGDDVPARTPDQTPTSNDDWYQSEHSGWDGIEAQQLPSAQGQQPRWQDRHDPCKDAFFVWGEGVEDERNFLASNIGLLAKRDQAGHLNVIATAIDSAAPLADVSLEVRNFQNQLMHRARTDADGFASLQLENTPFLLIARHQGDVGFLKLNRGSALPTSHFDAGGETVRYGLKGFVYGDRGVWRPGDEIHLVLMLKDARDRLPTNHPATLQLYDPRGKLVRSMTNSDPVDGFYRFSFATDSNASTGNWRAQVWVGGASFTKLLKIETVMPNRLRADLHFEQDSLHQGEQIQARLFSQWLHGAKANQLKADVSAKLVSGPTGFTRARDFNFDDPTRSVRSEPSKIFDGQLDKQGRAAFEFKLKPAAVPPGMMQARFTTRVFEPGGAFSTVSSSKAFHPFDRYVGIKLPEGDAARKMLQTDTDHTVEVATLDANGQAVSVDELEMTLYKLDWKWWWDQSGNDLARFSQSSYPQAIDQKIFSSDNGRGQVSFRVEYPDWGRYLIRVCVPGNAHCAAQVTYIDWPGWAGRAREQSGPGANALPLSADQEKYRVGETARLTLPETDSGRALLTLETGTSILDQRWIDMAKQHGPIEIPITAEMAPNVYAAVTLIQPHASKDNDRPIRLYGVLPILVENPDTVLQPQLHAKDLWRPRGPVSFEVSEASGQPMTYTVAVVDEGLLGLTSFRTPDPHRHFFKREAHGILSWDLFDLVAGAYGAALERLLALGGDAGGPSTQRQEESRFPPVVRFVGPFRLKADQTSTHQIDLPAYIGQVRLMLVAGNDQAYGKSEKRVTVREPLSVLTTLPRVLGPGESLRMPISVFAFEDSVRDVQLKVSTEGPLALSKEKIPPLNFSEPGEKLRFAELRVSDAIGPAVVTVEASSGAHKSSTRIALNVRSPNPVSSEIQRKAIAPGTIWQTHITPFGHRGTRSASMEISAKPPMDLGRRIDELVRYPHGCVEQLTSAAFPQLFVPRFQKLTPGASREIERNVSAAIRKLGAYQRADGSFAYWPGRDAMHDWSTSYVGHFLTQAKAAGFAIPGDMLDSWLRFQRSAAAEDRSGSLSQAYRLLSLALADQPDLAAMNRLRSSGKLSASTRDLLASAYAAAGLKDAARALLAQSARADTRHDLAANFPSKTRNRAIELMAQVQIENHGRVQKLTRALSDELASTDWLSTHASAWALIALGHAIGPGGSEEPFRFTYQLADSEQTSVTSTQSLANLNLSSSMAEGGALSISNTSAVPLYVQVRNSGSRKTDEGRASANGLSIDASYHSLDGTPLDVRQIEQGTDLVATLVISNSSGSDREDIAITQVLPSGWELRNARLLDGLPENRAAGEQALHQALYQDLRDDRVLSYFPLKRGESRTLQLMFNASYAGRWYLPGIAAEAMYDGSLQARTAGQWIEVVGQ